MTNDEKELGEAAVSMCKLLKAQARLIDGMRISQEALVNALRDINPALVAAFLSHRQLIDEQLTDRPLLAAIKLLDAMTTKLEAKYGPWKN
jgi:hypothetical protein